MFTQKMTDIYDFSLLSIAILLTFVFDNTLTFFSNITTDFIAGIINLLIQ
jgi:hypothetical protein